MSKTECGGGFLILVLPLTPTPTRFRIGKEQKKIKRDGLTVS